MGKTLIGAALLLLLTTSAGAQDAPAVIENTSNAMGADGLMALTYTGVAADVNFLQTRNINGPWPLRPITNYTRTLDLTAIGSRATGSTMNQGLFGGAPVPGTFNQGITPANTTWLQQLDYWVTPWGFLEGAAANGATARAQRLNGRPFRVVMWSPPLKAPSGASYLVTGYIGADNLVHRVETWVEHDMLGDLHVDTTYSDYKDFGGLKVPGRIVQKRGGFTFFEVTVADARTNPPNVAELLQAPAAPPRGGGAAPGAPPAGGARAGGPGGAPAAVPAPPPSTKLADGVYRINGAYNSLAVEFEDYVVVVEAGQNIARGQAILDEVKALIPNKPIRYVVNSHPHSDHAGGLAPLLADGATLVTHRNNKTFLERAFRAPRTLLGDALARSRRKPKVEGIGAKRVFRDDNHSLELHHIIDPDPEKVHSDGIIVAFLPKEKILFQADFTLPQGGAKPNPFVQSLAENLARLRLDFDSYLSVHNTPLQQTRSDLMTATGVTY
jgi:glyoxylase-like metal-dependent hydrolase (beta-lactamase superfamily II)